MRHTIVASQRMPYHVCDDDAMFVLCAIPNMSTTPLQVLRTIGEASISRVPALGMRNAIYCDAAALAMVLWTPIWRITRNFITIVHEGGHALVAVLTGRRLEGIRLHADTSGVTVSTGRDRGIGLIMTCFAGYASPALCGLGCAALIAHGYAVGVLWMLVVALVLLMTRVRNGYGWLVMVTVVTLTILVAWFGDVTQRAMLAHGIVWFLLWGTLRSLVELIHERAAGRGEGSDADQLGRTGLPAGIWIALWLLLATACLWCAGRWMLGIPLGASLSLH